MAVNGTTPRRTGRLGRPIARLRCPWNPDLVEQVGEAIGAEMLSVGCRQGLAPVLDVARDARWGRNEETFGEDPYLAGVMATRYVKGLQGEKRQVLATLKHFAGHLASEGGHTGGPSCRFSLSVWAWAVLHNV